MSFLSGCFQDFFFVFSFQKFNYDVFGIGFFGLAYWKFTQFLVSVGLFFIFTFYQIWEGFSHYFLEYSFSHSISSLIGLQWY